MNARSTIDLIRRAQNGNTHARDTLIETNMGLVHSIAGKMSGIPYDDRVSEGVFGLARAIEKFDIARGIAFSTYATLWIRSTIRRAIDNQANTIRKPVQVSENKSKIRRAHAKLSNALGREPTTEEVAAETGFSPEKVVAVEAATAQTPSSLDADVSDEGGATIAEAIGANDPNIELIHVVGQLDSALAVLGSRNRSIVERRFGFHGGEPETLDAVAKHFNLTRERIRQIEAEALSLMRDHPAVTAFLDAA